MSAIKRLIKSIARPKRKFSLNLKCPKCAQWTGDTPPGKGEWDPTPDVWAYLTCGFCGHRSRWRADAPIVVLDEEE